MDEWPKCFLCGRNGSQDRAGLEHHHIFGAARRNNSTKYDAVVLLCGEECHRLGKYSVHKCEATRIYLQQKMQKKLMEENNWTLDEWRQRFYVNYLDEEDTNAQLNRDHRKTDEGPGPQDDPERQ